MSEGQSQAAFQSVERPASKTYAGLWLRLLAWVVDVMILTFASIVYSTVLALPYFYASRSGFVLEEIGNLPTEELESVWGLFLLPLWAIYYGACESSLRGATPGKQLLRIRVLDRAGQRLTAGRAVLRVWPQYLLLVGPAFGVLVAAEAASVIVTVAILTTTVAMIPLTERRQGLHDIVTGCLVVRRNADLSQFAMRSVTS